MTITVILGTYNRSENLAKVLESVAASIVPPPLEWEVLVVNNNSSDCTRKVVQEFCARYPGRFRYLFERQQGLSYARNAGIRKARGRILAFLDDDLTVEPTWLQNLTAPLHDGRWAGAGGRILPERSFPVPEWLSVETLRMGGVLPFFDIGTNPGRLDRPPYGANMAYTKSMFEKYGLFRTDLGRRGESLISSEDTEFGRRLLTEGEHLRYEPSAIVYHAVLQERLEKRYFQAWWFGLGRSSVLLYGRGPDVWRIPRPCLSILKQAALIVKNAVRWAFALRPDQRFFFKLQVWNSAGSMVEFYYQLFEISKRGIPYAPRPVGGSS